MGFAMTTAQVMERLGVRDPDTIYAAHKAGKLPGCRLGRQYRFDSEIVEQFLRGEIQPPPRARRRTTAGGANMPPGSLGRMLAEVDERAARRRAKERKA